MITSMASAVEATTPEQLVSESDHVQLSRLVIEHAWRADHGRADTVHELYVDDGVLDVGVPVRGRDRRARPACAPGRVLMGNRSHPPFSRQPQRSKQARIEGV